MRVTKSVFSLTACEVAEKSPGDLNLPQVAKTNFGRFWGAVRLRQIFPGKSIHLHDGLS